MIACFYEDILLKCNGSSNRTTKKKLCRGVTLFFSFALVNYQLELENAALQSIDVVTLGNLSLRNCSIIISEQLDD